MSKIFTPSDREKRVSDHLRTVAVRQIEQQGVDEVAARLGLQPTGVEALLARRVWSFETAFRVADALGIAETENLEQLVSQ